MSRWRHVFLISSLPRLPGLDTVRSPPIGQSTLRYRLSVLEPAEQRMLASVESLLEWPAGWGRDTDMDCIARLRQGEADLPGAALRAHCATRLQTVVVLGALRARRRAPATPPAWLAECDGIGTLLRRRWSDADFGLAASHPWLAIAARRQGAADWEGLERGLIHREYTALAAMESAEEYGFEAVAAYVLRWGLLVRWLDFDAARASRRLAGLLDKALAGLEPLHGR